MEMKIVIDREGCEANNLLVYQLCEKASVELSKSNSKTPINVLQKPPICSPKSSKITSSNSSLALQSSAKSFNSSNPNRRIRSASTGRDKKSELQARYWALLFGNLQRAVNEIYQTVESYENISSCQETILVLENYVRDFKALSEWFKVSWDYESRPIQQRPHSLAWEIRKSNPLPRIRAKSLSSPTVSGKSSPNCIHTSGKSSPCCNFEMFTNRKCLGQHEQLSKRRMRFNVRELFSTNKHQIVGEQLNDYVVENFKLLDGSKYDNDIMLVNKQPDEYSSAKFVQEIEQNVNVDKLIRPQNINKCNQFSQTDLEDDHLTLADIREKLCQKEEINYSTQAQQNSNLISSEVNQKSSVISDFKNVENLCEKITHVDTDLLIKTENISEKPVENEKKNFLIEASNCPLKYSSVLNPSEEENMKVNVRCLSKTTTLNKSSPMEKRVLNTNLHRSSVIKSADIHGNFRSSYVSSSAKSKSLSKSINNHEIPNNLASRISFRSRTLLEMKTGSKTVNPAPTQIGSSKKLSHEKVHSLKNNLKKCNEFVWPTNNAKNYDRSSEPKNMQSDSNDGWLTVKNRRRSSIHWSSRFNRPTGYASLPTLALLNEKLIDTEQQANFASTFKKNGQITAIKESLSSKVSLEAEKAKTGKSQKPLGKATKISLRSEIKNIKAKVNSFPLNQKSSTIGFPKKLTTPSKLSKPNVDVPNSLVLLEKQKSDLTGLQIMALHQEYIALKQNNISKDDNYLISNSTSLKNSNLNSSEETVIETNHENSTILEQSKIDIKIQTNSEFSKTISDLYESVPLTSKVMEMFDSKILRICDDNEETLVDEIECDEDQRILLEEQESLERQIRELENTEIDVDTETDETDCEVFLDNENGREDNNACINDSSSVVFVLTDNDNNNSSLEMRYQALLSEMSWNEREETLATLHAYVTRHPGRAQELHKKLSSPSRCRSLQETLKKYQAKQARAQQKRELLQKEKTIKIQQLLARVEDVKIAKQQLIENKRLKMEDKMQRAAENREQYLRHIVEKAHDEEKKLKEINFIKNIEAQNKRLDLIESSKETEGRLQDLEQERQKRLEEKAAKEVAAERRRQAMEDERQRKLEKINEIRLKKEQRIDKMQEQKELKRLALAREKARDREERLLALQAQHQQSTEELQRKITQKQIESARRHEENIEHIRQRALELSIPSRNLDENGQPRIENIEQENHVENGDLLILSEIGNRDYRRGLKKKLKKLKQRLSQSSEEYMKELQPIQMHIKRESQIPKYLKLICKGGGTQGIERQLGQLIRVTEKGNVNDFQCFFFMDGLGIITNNVIAKGNQKDAEVSKKAIVLAVQLYRNTCSLCPQIARHALLGNSIVTLFDILLNSLQLPEKKSPQQPVSLSTELLLACTIALTPSQTKKHTNSQILKRLPDLLSYLVNIGLVELLARQCMNIHESIENQQSAVLSLLATLGFITKLVDICPPGSLETSQFLNVTKSTELFGSISMLYSIVVPIGESIPPRTISLAAATFNFFVSIAVGSLSTFQEVLSSESLLFKFLDVVTLLLKYCGNENVTSKNGDSQAVIIDVVASIGFLCVNNIKNQDLLTSDQYHNILKNIKKLSGKLDVVVYPCLVTISFNNKRARSILARDFDLDNIDAYSRSDIGRRNHLIALLKIDS